MTGTTPASIVAPSHRNIWPERHWRYYQYETIWQAFIYSLFANSVIRRLYDTAPVTGGGGTEDEQIKARRTGGSVASAKREQERRFGNGRLCGVRLSCLRWIRPIFRITAISGNWILMIYPNYWAIAGLKGRLKSKDTCLVYSGVFSSDKLQWFLHAGAL